MKIGDAPRPDDEASSIRSAELGTLARRLTNGLPPGVVEEVVLTGSVSRGTADDASDIEMLVVTRDALPLEDCMRLAQAAGLERIDTWGAGAGPARTVSGRLGQVPVELVWWPREHAEERVVALLAGQTPSTADALFHGLPLRTAGRLAVWQERLSVYPPGLAERLIEDAAARWSGYAPEALLTLVRPGDRLALTEWTVDAADRVLTIVYALNRMWRPTTKRLASRVGPLGVKPAELSGRLEAALVEPDAARALLGMAELQFETVLLAPRGPNVDRARAWLAEGANLLRAVLA